MRTVDTTEVQASTEQEYAALETDTYDMKIIKARYIKSDRFVNQRTGEPDEQVMIVWELLSPLKHPQSPEVEYRDRVTQYMSSWIGTSKTNGDSKFKRLLDSFREQGLIGQHAPIAEDESEETKGALIGIRQRVMVEKFHKPDGRWINKVIAVAPPRNGQVAPQPTPAPAAPDITDNQYFDYLKAIVAEVNNTADNELLTIAQELVPATNNPFWAKKNLADRNPEQLRMDIKTMWTLVERYRKESETGELAW